MSTTTPFDSRYPVRPLKHVAPLRSEKVDAVPTDGEYLGLEQFESWTGRLSAVELQQQPEGNANVFYEGDVLFGKLRPYLAKGWVASRQGYCTTESLVLVPQDADARFVRYCLLTNDAISAIDGSTYGSKMPRADWTYIGSLQIPCPNKARQQRIANFLDEKTARIDALIAEKQLLLDKLSELRSSTISDEVVIQKAGWRKTRLKYLTTEIVDTEHKTAPFFDDGQYLVVRTSNVKAGQLVLENAKYTDQAGFEEWTRRGVPNENDILFTREAPAGEACLVPAGIPLCVGQRTVLLRLDRTKAYPSFVLWSLYGGLATRFIEDLSQGSTVAHFNMPDIGNIPLFTGPVEEQKSHAQALEDRLKAIDELVSHATKHIDRLREYRSSLISAAVTGQLDISDYRPATGAAA